MQVSPVIQTLRPPFLVLTPLCVLLGFSAALMPMSAVNYLYIFLILVAALCAAISANTFNEYLDFKSGLDFTTQKTGFSGGSGALPACPQVAGVTLKIALISLFVMIAIGIYFVLVRGMLILPLGIVGCLLIIGYTPWINRHPFICLIAPGTGFGLLMVVGTNVLLSGHYSHLSLLVSLVPFFLVNNLLLLNQYPDIKADADVGRKTFPIIYGITKSNYVYALFSASAYLLIVLYINLGYLPTLSYIALIPWVFSVFALMGSTRYKAEIGHYPQYLGANVMAVVLTLFLLPLSILLG